VDKAAASWGDSDKGMLYNNQRYLIAGAYFKDLGIGLLLCGVGAFSFIRNNIRRRK